MTNALITQAIQHGSAVGQTALAEFILRDYGEEISPELTLLLRKVAFNGCEDIARDLERPAEDIALEVSKIIHK